MPQEFLLPMHHSFDKKKIYVYQMGFVIKKGMEKPEIVRFKKHKSNSGLQTRLG